MKVALLSSGSGSRGGGEIYLQFLAEGLTAAGHEVSAMLPDAVQMNELEDAISRVASVARIPLQSTYKRRLRSVGAAFDWPEQRRISKMLATLDVDIIHINQQVAEDGLDLILAAAASGKSWLSTIHIGHSANTLKAKSAFVRDLTTRNVMNWVGGRHIAVSAESRAQLVQRFRKCQFYHVANGVPVPNVADLASARRAARAEWGISDTEIVVGTVGRIEPQKGPFALVEYAAAVAELLGSQLHLVWIGDGSLRSEFEAFAASHSDRIKLIVDGWRSDASLRLAALDIFVMPSVFEGLPLALLEAMHAGLPVVATRTDGMVEAVVEKQTGFLCDTPKNWIEALGALISRKDQRIRLGDQATQVARDRFSASKMAAGTDEVYCALMRESALNK